MTTMLQPPLVSTPARARSLTRDFLLSPFEARSWRAAASIVLGLFVCSIGFGLVASFFSTGGSLLIVLIGVAFIGIGIEIARLIAQVERWRMTMVDPRPLRPHPYRAYGKGLRSVCEAEFFDESRWRDVIYVLISFPLSILEFTLFIIVWSICLAFLVAPLVYIAVSNVLGDRIPVSVAHAMPVAMTFLFMAGLVLIPVGFSVSRGLTAMHRAVVQGLLCENEAAELRRRVDTLRDSRSAMLQIEATELRRIERDLHDGAQQRLVMLAIDLSLARDKLESDPTAARSLMDDAREQARQALAELRDLVRGSAPAILLDRGLVAALGAVAGRCPVPTIVESSLVPGERQPHAVERAAYFLVSEALTNVAKHAQATRCEVRCGRCGDWLIVEVWDDGKGGATISDGGGLAGLRDRVEALDGTFRLDSPAGGPTLLRAEFPIGLPAQQ